MAQAQPQCPGCRKPLPMLAHQHEPDCPGMAPTPCPFCDSLAPCQCTDEATGSFIQPTDA